MIRAQIWTALGNARYKAHCLCLLLTKYQKLDRGINIGLALVSSSSIAAWAVWSYYPMVWGAIIACSQVLMAIKPYIPYFKYVKEFSEKSVKADLLCLDFERLWYRFEHKKVTEDEAVETFYDLRKQMSNIFNFGDDTIFDVTPGMYQKADAYATAYLKNNYNF